MTWAYLYLICFALGIAFSVLSFFSVAITGICHSMSIGTAGPTVCGPRIGSSHRTIRLRS